jgi:hypothetical protein
MTPEMKEVRDDILRCQADSQGHNPASRKQRRQLDAQNVENDIQPDEDRDGREEIRCGLDRDLVALVMPLEVAQRQTTNPQGHPKGDHDNPDKDESLFPCDLGRAESKQGLGEEFVHLRMPFP